MGDFGATLGEGAEVEVFGDDSFNFFVCWITSSLIFLFDSKGDSAGVPEVEIFWVCLNLAAFLLRISSTETVAFESVGLRFSSVGPSGGLSRDDGVFSFNISSRGFIPKSIFPGFSFGGSAVFSGNFFRTYSFCLGFFFFFFLLN